MKSLHASGREVIEIGHAELERFAGNMLELGTWDEALGDSRVLVMSETARRALKPETYARLSGSHRHGAGGAGADDRAAGRRERALHARRSVPADHGVIELLLKGGLCLSPGLARREPGHRQAHGRGGHPHARERQRGGDQCAAHAGQSGCACWVLVIDLAKGWIATGMIAPWRCWGAVGFGDRAAAPALGEWA